MVLKESVSNKSNGVDRCNIPHLQMKSSNEPKRHVGT